jgi:hypothetical protein
MISLLSLAADKVAQNLAEDWRRMFGAREPQLAEFVGSLAELALERIGNSDALFHDAQHTILVTLVGRDILRGRALTEPVSPSDWAHFVIACLFHDIGYVRGVLQGDREPDFVADETGRTVKLPRGASDAALIRQHVDRSKMFIRERLGGSDLLDAERIARAVEFTRFPVVVTPEEAGTGTEAGLVRAADLIGQLGDPLYLRKANALYWEFEEAGLNRQLGYSSPADLVDRYPEFFWRHVSPYLQEAIAFLNVTVSGRQWIANMHHNVFCAEHQFRLVGPQR